MAHRILLLDDEPSILFSMREYLALEGHSVECARSGGEALARLSAHHFDLLVADLRLSGSEDTQGLDVVARARQAHPDLRVVVLTACDAGLEEEALRRGADRFLQKPQRLSHVAAIIDGLLGHPVKNGAETPAGPAAALPVAPGRPQRAGGPRKILLVDDSSTVLLAERILLRDYEIVTARDGLEAVEKAVHEKPDLILMDVVMPRLDGLEACRRLRAETGTRHIPVILVTTRGELENVETGYQAGCDDYVTKPFRGHELLSKVRSNLGERVIP